MKVIDRICFGGKFCFSIMVRLLLGLLKLVIELFKVVLLIFGFVLRIFACFVRAGTP